MGRKPLLSIRAILFFSLLITMGALASCSDEGPAGTSGNTDRSGEVDPRGDTDFFLGSASIDGVPDGRIDVWAHNLTIRSDSTGDSGSVGAVVAFDVVLINRSHHAVHPPVLFFITQITPSSVFVLNSEIVYASPAAGITDGDPGFDFSDDLGDDNQLDPREHSAPVNVQFGMEELTSFSIGFEITVGSPPGPPPSDVVISGVVFNDADQNGERDSTEAGLPGVKVRLSTNVPPGTDPFEVERVTETDRLGRYGFGDLRTGIYDVQAFPGPIWNETTPNPLIVTLIGDSSGVRPIDGVDFGFFTKEPPEIDPVFGPVNVGPGSMHGPRFEGGFWVRSLDNRKYVLEVMPPPIMSSGPMLIRIDKVRAWVNGELLYSFDCDSMEHGCLPGERVVIPPRFLREGPNRIQILVEGNERAFLMFTIFRVSDGSEP